MEFIVFTLYECELFVYVVVVIIYSLVAAFLKHFGLIPMWGNWQLTSVQYHTLQDFVQLHSFHLLSLVITLHHGEACGDYITSWWGIWWLHCNMVSHLMTALCHGEACGAYMASHWGMVVAPEGLTVLSFMVRHVVTTFHHGEAWQQLLKVWP